MSERGAAYQVGVLKALGASTGGIRGIFLGYGLLLGVVGSGIGMAGGLLFVHYINDIEKLLSKFTGHKVFDDTMTNMRAGLRDHLVPPKFLLEKVAKQSQSIVDSKGEDSPFAQPIKHFPDSISEADRTRIRTEVLAAIDHDIIPMYAKFTKFVAEDYAPHGRTEVGMWSLPEGAKRYAVAAKRSTTTKPIERATASASRATIGPDHQG